MPEADVPRISPDEVGSAAEPLTFLDVRGRPDDKQIRGSVRYDPKQLRSAETLALPLPRDGTLVVYCGHGNSSVEIAAKLRAQGYENARSLEGGYTAWVEAGLPTEELSQLQPIPGVDDSGIKLV